MRVLVADNSSMMLESIGEMISCYNRVEAEAHLKRETKKWEALRILKPDKTIVEIRMPGLSGPEVLNEIKKKKKDVKLFVLTFYKSDYYPQCTILDGAEYFFSKMEDGDEKS